MPNNQAIRAAETGQQIDTHQHIIKVMRTIDEQKIEAFTAKLKADGGMIGAILNQVSVIAFQLLGAGEQRGYMAFTNAVPVTALIRINRHVTTAAPASGAASKKVVLNP